MKNIKQLEKEIEELINDENIINDYIQTLKEIEEKFKSKGDDLETGMFILLTVAKLKTLQEVCKEIQVAFNKCSSCMLDIVKEKPRDNNTQRDWEQRIDELILLYSSISGLNYNEAKEELLNKLKSDEK